MDTFVYKRGMLAPQNMARMTCPVFPLDVEVRTCFRVHDLFMKGKPHPKRAGCNACMAAGKCPARLMVQESIRAPRPVYFSETPAMVTLSDDILEDVGCIVVSSKMINQFGCTSKEVAFIEAATTPRHEVAKTKRRRGAVQAPKSTLTPRPAHDDAPAAAETGDMAAAVTAAAVHMKEAS
ncbi:hypothetical protein F1188_19665 [Roseospira marina]|uniref:Uncharacterized protein n=1 Tax=Roseospira marina TaxID=140057 RepID=A0A5M6I5K8_9PROT|nr:hypothetical protein [Roseospira marina]KAA5603494.1 hypothetical protein F1188_19665 [Roseospira marina]MBB4315478.1 hypothetical protein [Roseospira marina]MBB5088376.1 hypothetical protein [Roseospira marina]